MAKNMTKSAFIEAVSNKLGDGVSKKQVATVLETMIDVGHKELKKSGAFIPGYRPGEQTAKYIEKITLRLTLIGSIYLVIVCFIPNFLIAWKNVPFYFGGTSLLIIVVVTMDFMTQVQAYLMSQQYESLLKKANFKGGGAAPTR